MPKLHAGHGLLAITGFFAVVVGCVAVAESERPRLVGLGCGPDHETLIAVNEDDFPPPCYVVDTPQNLCGTDDALSCANYMGEGY